MKWSMFMSTHKNDDSTPKHAICKLGNDNPIQRKTTLSLLIMNRKNILLCQTIYSSVRKRQFTQKNALYQVPIALKKGDKKRKGSVADL